ncbi:DUF4357 domain-containing protein [Sporolactobacillus terrae]|uniref:DUF4357 domain-containing protein n=1 Tax=Sporolactobacillus terrae TaxID=269673 RepID=UPI00111A4B78|nr:DUF4357 domain-containing protein [Sporolactobacillus terrae]
MKAKLSAQETPLYKAFSDDYLYTVPSVQRPYSWTSDEAAELLDDLLEFIDYKGLTENNINDIDEPYFLGCIVLVKQDSPESEVLDGQQRLTTLTILLSALRSLLSDDYAKDLENMIVQKGSKILGTSDTYRLKLRQRDDSFFKKYVLEKGKIEELNSNIPVKTDSQKLIRDNAIYFVNRLCKLNSKRLKILSSVLATQCYFVIVSTPNFDSAFRIFTVLNDRGLDLLPSDIFKAKVIGAIPENEQDVYTNRWEEAEVSLGRDRFNKLFDHIRMILQKRKGSANYKDEYDKIFKNITGKKFIDDVLLPYSEIYTGIIEYRSFYSSQPQIMKLFSLLNRIDNNDWIPLALFYIHLYNNERLKDFLNLLETFASISMILRKNFNWRMSKYSQVLRQLDKGVDIFSDESLLKVANEDKSEVLEKLNGDVYTDLKDSVRKYILLRLDSLLADGQPYYDHSVITVEHVLPQNPAVDSEWLKYFDDPSKYVHKLGNLVLLTRSKNSQASNYDFNKKKTSYFQSKKGVTTFALTTQVIREKEWTPEILKKRQKQLIDLLKKKWDLYPSLKENKINSENNPITCYLNGLRGAKASATFDSNLAKIKVLKGSIFAEPISENLQENYQEKRNELIKRGLLILNDSGNFSLTEDYTFTSPSTAAAIVLGRSANGWTAWHTENGNALDVIRISDQ